MLGLDPQRAEDHRQLTRRVGVMLQRGGVYPAMAPAEAIRLFARYYDQPEDPDVLLERLASDGCSGANPVASPVGRRTAAPVAGPGAGGPPGGGVPRRADGRGRPAGPAGHPGGDRRAARRRRVRGLTTHELDEAERVADRIVIIDRGRVVAAGTPPS